MVLEYDGSRFNGWQKQKNTDNTIQGKLEEIFSRYFGETVEVNGSGRTDAGVHAVGQVASFKITGRVGDYDKVKRELNNFLPEDIKILSLSETDPRFHARLNAVAKEYRYYICLDEKRSVFNRKYQMSFTDGQRLDGAKIERMAEASKLFLGEHDFAGFSDNKSNKSTVRRVDSIEFNKKDDVLCVIFKGNGFLYHMVRLMMGTLIDIAFERRELSYITDVLEGREKAVNKAFAGGLFLQKVEY